MPLWVSPARVNCLFLGKACSCFSILRNWTLLTVNCLHLSTVRPNPDCRLSKTSGRFRRFRLGFYFDWFLFKAWTTGVGLSFHRPLSLHLRRLLLGSSSGLYSCSHFLLSLFWADPFFFLLDSAQRVALVDHSLFVLVLKLWIDLLQCLRNMLFVFGRTVWKQLICLLLLFDRPV